MSVENMMGLLIIIFLFILLVAIILGANRRDKKNEAMQNEAMQNEAMQKEAMQKELKKVEEKYQKDIDNMRVIYWYEEQKIKAKTDGEYKYCDDKSSEAAKIFLNACLAKTKEEEAIYKKYGLDYREDK